MATGFAAMQQAVKNINTPKGGGGRRFSYFNLEDQESVIIRFLTDEDEIVTCDFYEYVNVKNKDKDGKVVDGQNSFIVAPSYYADRPEANVEDWVLKYGGKAKKWGETELSDPVAKERTVAIAVEREAVPVETAGGRPKFKYRDKVEEITLTDKDGKESTFLSRNFIIIRKDAKTFWGNVVGYYSEFGTLVDRDYKITRQGKSLATNYSCIPVGPEDDWSDIDQFRKELQARYGYGTGKDADGNELTKDSESRFLYCPMTLAQWCEDQSSEERAKSMLTGTTRGESTNGSASPAPSVNGSDADEAQAAPAPDGGAVSNLRARLEAHT